MRLWHVHAGWGGGGVAGRTRDVGGLLVTVRINTVLVLGAGSSFGFGLPLGSGLRKIIADDLNIMFDDCGSRLESGSGEIVEALRVLIRTNDGAGSDINSHRQAEVTIALLCLYGAETGRAAGREREGQCG